MKDVNQSIVLQNGVVMPLLGLGTWQLQGAQCERVVRQALELGYRHIDTAEMYDNQHEIGRAIRHFDRSKLFIVSKIAPAHLHYREARMAADRILRELSIDYLDLLLIHWPDSRIDMVQTFQALQDLVEEGRTRAAGVSNFTIGHLQRLLPRSNALISVNQVEYHPYLNQEDLRRYCRDEGIVVTAYSPLARGDLLQDPLLQEIAARHRAGVPEVALRWLIQKRMAAIPKAGSAAHLEQNRRCLELELDPDEMAAIDHLNRQRRKIDPPWGEFSEQAGV
jgi:2,5-diketo-D-gluconate reductase B